MTASTSFFDNIKELSLTLRNEIGDGDKNLEVDDICDSFFDIDNDVYIEEDAPEEQSKDHEESCENILSKAKELKIMLDHRKMGKKKNFLEMSKDLATLTPITPGQGVINSKGNLPNENLEDVTLKPLSKTSPKSSSSEILKIHHEKSPFTTEKTYSTNMSVVSSKKGLESVPGKVRGTASKVDLSVLEDTSFTQYLFRALDLKVTSRSREKSKSTSQKKFPTNPENNVSLEKANRLLPVIDKQQLSHIPSKSTQDKVISFEDIPDDVPTDVSLQDNSELTNEVSASIARNVPESNSKGKLDEPSSPEYCENPLEITAEKDRDLQVLSPYKDTNSTTLNEESTYEDNFQPIITQVFSIAPQSTTNILENVLSPQPSIVKNQPHQSNQGSSKRNILKNLLSQPSIVKNNHPHQSDQGSSKPSNVSLLMDSTKSTTVINSDTLTGANLSVNKSLTVQPTLNEQLIALMVPPAQKSHVPIQPWPKNVPKLAQPQPKNFQASKFPRNGNAQMVLAPENPDSQLLQAIHELESTGNSACDLGSMKKSNFHYQAPNKGESLDVIASQPIINLPQNILSNGKPMPKLKRNCYLSGSNSLGRDGEATESADKKETTPAQTTCPEAIHETLVQGKIDWVLPNKGPSFVVANLPKDVQSEPLCALQMERCNYIFTEGKGTTTGIFQCLRYLREVVKISKNLSTFRKCYAMNLIEEILTKSETKDPVKLVQMYRSDVKDLFTKDFDQHAFLYFEASMGCPLEMCIICLEMKKNLLFLKFLNHFVEDHVQSFPGNKIFSYANKMQEVLQKMKKSFRYMKHFGKCLLSFNIEKQIQLIVSRRLHDATEHLKTDSKRKRKRQQKIEHKEELSEQFKVSHLKTKTANVVKPEKVAEDSRNLEKDLCKKPRLGSGNEDLKQNKPNNVATIEFIDERLALDEDPLSLDTLSEDTLPVQFSSQDNLPAKPKKSCIENHTRKRKGTTNSAPLLKPSEKDVTQTKSQESKPSRRMDNRSVEYREGEDSRKTSKKKRKNKEKIKIQNKKVKLNGTNKSDKDEIITVQDDSKVNNQTAPRKIEDYVDDEDYCYENDYEGKEDEDDYDEVDVEAVNKKILDILSKAKEEIDAEKAKQREIDHLSHIIKPSKTYQNKMSVVEVSPYMRVFSPQKPFNAGRLPIKTYSKKTPPNKVPLTTVAQIPVNSSEKDKQGKEITDDSDNPTDGETVTKAGNEGKASPALENTQTALVAQKDSPKVVNDDKCVATTDQVSTVIDNALVTPGQINEITWHLFTDDKKHLIKNHIYLEKIQSPSFGKIEFLNDSESVDPVLFHLKEQLNESTSPNGTKRKSEDSSETTHQIKKLCVRQTDSCIEISAKIVEEGGEMTDEDNEKLVDDCTEELYRIQEIDTPDVKKRYNSNKTVIPKEINGVITSTCKPLPEIKSNSTEMNSNLLRKILPKNIEGVVTSTYEPPKIKYDSTKIKSKLQKQILAKRIDEIITSNFELLPEIKSCSIETKSNSSKRKLAKKNEDVITSKSESLIEKKSESIMTKQGKENTDDSDKPTDSETVTKAGNEGKASPVEKGITSILEPLFEETSESIVTKPNLPKKTKKVITKLWKPLFEEISEPIVTKPNLPKKTEKVIASKSKPLPKKKSKTTKIKSNLPKKTEKVITSISEPLLEKNLESPKTKSNSKKTEEVITSISEPEPLLEEETDSSTTKPFPSRSCLSKKIEDVQNEYPHRMECSKKLAIQQNSLILIFNFLSKQINSDKLSSSEILETFKGLPSVTTVDVRLLEMILNEFSHEDNGPPLPNCLKLVQDYLDTLVSCNPRRLIYTKKKLKVLLPKLRMKKQEYQRMTSCKIVLDKLSVQDIRRRGIKISADSLAMLENLHPRRNSASGEEVMSNIIDFVTRNS